MKFIFDNTTYRCDIVTRTIDDINMTSDFIITIVATQLNDIQLLQNLIGYKDEVIQGYTVYDDNEDLIAVSAKNIRVIKYSDRYSDKRVFCKIILVEQEYDN